MRKSRSKIMSEKQPVLKPDLTVVIIRDFSPLEIKLIFELKESMNEKTASAVFKRLLNERKYIKEISVKYAHCNEKLEKIKSILNDFRSLLIN